MQEPEWFPSAVDWWVGVAILIGPVVSVGVLIMSIILGEGVWVAALSCLLVAALYAAVVIPVRYGLEADHLVVRFGVFRQRIAYRDIRGVRPTRNLLSSPALSLHRLRVDQGKGFWHGVMISPDRRDDFLAALARRTGLRRSGDALVPPEELRSEGV